MKSLLVTLALITTSALASAQQKCTIFHENACIISGDESSFLIEVHYPNYTHCGLKILPAVSDGTSIPSNFEMLELAQEISVVAFDSSANREIELPLQLGGNQSQATHLVTTVGSESLFIIPITFKTKNGELLGAVIARHLDQTGSGDAKLVVTSVLCN